MVEGSTTRMSVTRCSHRDGSISARASETRCSRSSAAAELIERDAIDEYVLFVHPIVLGAGLPLFANLSEERPLQLQDSRPFPCGVVRLRYARKR
jgi:hypothetical protein